MKKLILVLGLMSSVLLAGCAAHPPALTSGTPGYLNTNVNYLNNGEKATYVYTPAQIDSTWVNTHKLNNDMVVGGHYVVWKARQGYFNAPEVRPGQGAGLLKPADSNH